MIQRPVCVWYTGHLIFLMFDELWPGGPKFRQSTEGFPLSTDAVLLADFVRNVPARRILDLGCGAGVLMILLRQSHPHAQIEGIELQNEAAALCRENLSANGDDFSGVLNGDLREHRNLLPVGGYDLVISNPPYFPVGSGYSADTPERIAAREERTCTLSDLCAAARYLCRWGGVFAVVYRPERLSELLTTMSGAGLEAKRLRMVQYRATSQPNLILVAGRRGGKPGLSIAPPLLLTDDTGADSPEIKRIYHRDYMGTGENHDGDIVSGGNAHREPRGHQSTGA